MRRIKELFDNPVPWKIITKFSDEIEVEFSIDDVKYTISFSEWESVWELNFASTGHNGHGRVFNITDQGNAFTVFSTVANFLKEVTRNPNIRIFYFTAKEPSRIRLYDTFAQLIEKKLGFTWKKDYAEPGVKMYWFERK